MYHRFNFKSLAFCPQSPFLQKRPCTYSVGIELDFNYCLEECKKGKAVPLQAWSGPKGYRKLRFPDFMATAQDGGKFVTLTHRSHLPPGNTPGTHSC